MVDNGFVLSFPSICRLAYMDTSVLSFLAILNIHPNGLFDCLANYWHTLLIALFIEVSHTLTPVLTIHQADGGVKFNKL